MKILELLSEHIEEELEDACTYADLAVKYKEDDPELAQLFYKLSQEEMTHMDALHNSVVKHIDAYKRDHGEAPAGMKALYNYLHNREAKKAEKVAVLQTLAKK